jgi:hypothetical protein
MTLTTNRPLDCPECSSAGSVTKDFCEVCYAELGEMSWFGERLPLHPSIRLRFNDVVEELRSIADRAARAVEVDGSRLAAACRRAESLLRLLRLQFMDDVVFPSELHSRDR